MLDVLLIIMSYIEVYLFEIWEPKLGQAATFNLEVGISQALTLIYGVIFLIGLLFSWRHFKVVGFKKGMGVFIIIPLVTITFCTFVDVSQKGNFELWFLIVTPITIIVSIYVYLLLLSKCNQLSRKNDKTINS
jgi:ABC-type transport system involved in cytochrome c biogenesis permease subunit